jgi:hypothetical protein
VDWYFRFCFIQMPECYLSSQNLWQKWKPSLYLLLCLHRRSKLQQCRRLHFASSDCVTKLESGPVMEAVWPCPWFEFPSSWQQCMYCINWLTCFLYFMKWNLFEIKYFKCTALFIWSHYSYCNHYGIEHSNAAVLVGQRVMCYSWAKFPSL